MDKVVSRPTNQCRICLEASDAMPNLFEDISTTYKLELCCGVQISNIPNLPSGICKKCSDILNVAYDFRVLCQRSQEFLAQQTVAQEDNNCKPNLSDIDLTTNSSLEDNVEYIQDERRFTENEETIEEHIEINESDDEEAEESNNKECVSTSDDKEIESQSSTSERMKTGNFKTRAPRRKPTTSLMCNVCGNIYKNKATFSYHMKLHQNDKKYECEICAKRFMQTCELRAHIRVHTGEKPFTCSYCDRKFRDRSGVTRHERTHTNERPYGCTVCGAHFSYSATLKKHERVHTGEKPFKCMICVKQFSEQHQLKAHLATIRHREIAREKSKSLIV